VKFKQEEEEKAQISYQIALSPELSRENQHFQTFYHERGQDSLEVEKTSSRRGRRTW